MLIIIPIEPVSQLRPRATTVNGRPRVYDPSKVGDLLIPALITIIIAAFCYITHFPLQILAFIVSLIALVKSR